MDILKLIDDLKKKVPGFPGYVNRLKVNFTDFIKDVGKFNLTIIIIGIIIYAILNPKLIVDIIKSLF